MAAGEIAHGHGLSASALKDSLDATQFLAAEHWD